MQYVGSSIKDGSLDQGVDDSDGLTHPETKIKIWTSAVKRSVEELKLQLFDLAEPES
jgi:hypothetical protein